MLGDEWAELWQLVNEWLSRRDPRNPNATEDVAYRIASLNLLNRLAEIPATLKLLDHHVEMFIQFLSQSLDPCGSFEEKRAAFEVIAAIDEGSVLMLILRQSPILLFVLMSADALSVFPPII